MRKCHNTTCARKYVEDKTEREASFVCVFGEDCLKVTEPIPFNNDILNTKSLLLKWDNEIKMKRREQEKKGFVIRDSIRI